jgi:hypothetical protein
MTIENIRTRKSELSGRRSALRDQIMQGEAQLEQMRQNVCAFNGAIEECDFWLSKLLDEKPNAGENPQTEQKEK